MFIKRTCQCVEFEEHLDAVIGKQGGAVVEDGASRVYTFVSELLRLYEYIDVRLYVWLLSCLFSLINFRYARFRALGYLLAYFIKYDVVNSRLFNM